MTCHILVYVRYAWFYSWELQEDKVVTSFKSRVFTQGIVSDITDMSHFQASPKHHDSRCVAAFLLAMFSRVLVPELIIFAELFSLGK